MTLHVRRARSEDTGAACATVRRSIEVCSVEDHGGERARLDAWPRNKTPEDFLAWIQDDDLYCNVAERGSNLVGFGMASFSGELLLCFGTPEVRFQGVGKAVLQAIEHWATTSSIAGASDPITGRFASQELSSGTEAGRSTVNPLRPCRPCGARR